jgi:hypothetical protein
VAARSISWVERLIEAPVTSLAESRSHVTGQQILENTLASVMVGGLAITTEICDAEYEKLVT